ncbi:MAG: YkgJ family cysteine cluster protein [Desulfuromonadales bacterium]
MDDILDRYGELLQEVDAWFKTCLERYPGQISCHSGCSHCCRGLFDVTLLDALFLKQGVDNLDDATRQRLSADASQRLATLSSQFPRFVEPWLLNTIPEDEWEPLMPEEDEAPCLLLGGDGRCLVYEQRPMTCRLNGIPMIDLSGEELFDEWCTLNFVTADPRKLRGLRFGFSELFTRELLLFQELTRTLTGTALNEVDLFIPAAVVLDPEKALPVVRMLAVSQPPR